MPPRKRLSEKDATPPSSSRKTRNSNFSKEAAAAVIRDAAERWPTSFVSRNSIREFSGGLYSPGTLANFDSQKNGPEGAFRVGRQIVYPVPALIDWLIARIEA